MGRVDLGGPGSECDWRALCENLQIINKNIILKVYLLFIVSPGACVCTCARMPVCTNLCVHVPMEVRGQHWSSVSLHVIESGSRAQIYS